MNVIEAVFLLQNSNTARHVLDGAGQVKQVIWDSFDRMATFVVSRLPYVVAAIIVVVLSFFLAGLLKRLFWAASKRTQTDRQLRILFSRLITVVVVAAGVLAALTIIVPSFALSDVIAGLGFTSFVVGFATKDILNNLLSGVLILWRQPFKIGDQISLGTNQGKVEYIGVRATTLRKDDGEIILIPNSEMYSSVVTIRGAGDRLRMTLKLKIGFDQNPELTKRSALDGLNTVSGIVDSPPPTALVTEFAPSGVSITVTFWIDTNERKPQEIYDQAAIGILAAIRKAGLELFPPEELVLEKPVEIIDERKKKKDALD